MTYLDIKNDKVVDYKMEMYGEYLYGVRQHLRRESCIKDDHDDMLQDIKAENDDDDDDMFQDIKPQNDNFNDDMFQDINKLPNAPLCSEACMRAFFLKVHVNVKVNVNVKINVNVKVTRSKPQD